ncbi:WXG100 family type VII secretion target [Glycomyces terrestris]|uniref:WXG100 family type VII secretion target n=1 Tax=Glycomyces terrestris TaxID=2493553 RepID=A0A426UY13_9ACTN|nr:WXG100 family type VII secretion target [Glycomyces terrestris]RRR99460.1 WXG100 family type VII secretion target [Glycomyces terrestris]
MSDNESTSALDAAGAGRPGCSHPDCGNATAHPAERHWQQVMAAVPVEGQSHRPKATATSYPTGADFRAALAAVRPDDADAHSLQHLRTAWTDEVSGRLADWPERIRSHLADLAEGWSGAGFDAFEAACDQTRGLVEDLIDDVDATAASLQAAEDALHLIQGGGAGEIPYPAAQFWIDGDWHSWVSVHIRPAWWHGDCIRYTCQDAEHVLALAGAEPALATEIIDYIDERILHHIDRYARPDAVERDGLDPAQGLTVEEAKDLAVADATEHYATLVEQSWGAYAARHTAVDDDLVRRNADTEAELRSLRTVRSDKDYPAAADPAYMDLEPPPLDQPTGTETPRAADEPSLQPPTLSEDAAEEDRPSGDAAAPSAVPAAVGTAAATSAIIADPWTAPAATGAARSTDEADLAEDGNLWGVVDEDDDPYA